MASHATAMKPIVHSKPCNQNTWIGRIITFVNDLAWIELIPIDPDGIGGQRHEAGNAVLVKAQMRFAEEQLLLLQGIVLQKII
jgi:hypothetical protein